MSRRPKRVFTDEFKDEEVKLARASGKSIGQVDRDLDLTESALREWVRRAQPAGPSGTGPLSANERQELARLRKENRVLQMERDFLK